MADLVPVRMVAHHLCNSPGDECGFPPDVANMLVEMGAAHYIGKPPVREAAQSEKAAAAPPLPPAGGGGSWQGEEPERAAAPAAELPAEWLLKAPKKR